MRLEMKLSWLLWVPFAIGALLTADRIVELARGGSVSPAELMSGFALMWSPAFDREARRPVRILIFCLTLLGLALGVLRALTIGSAHFYDWSAFVGLVLGLAVQLILFRSRAWLQR